VAPHTPVIAIPRRPDEPDAIALSAVALDIDLILETTYMETTHRPTAAHCLAVRRTVLDRALHCKSSMSLPGFSTLLWFLFVLFFVSFLDRINIGFCGLTMMKDLAFPESSWSGHNVVLYRPTSRSAFRATSFWRASVRGNGSEPS